MKVESRHRTYLCSWVDLSGLNRISSQLDKRSCCSKVTWAWCPVPYPQHLGGRDGIKFKVILLAV